MNEKYGIEPSACNEIIEWRYLLDKFGPFTGRYIAKFPQDWEKQILNQILSNNWLEIERLKVLLRRAFEKKLIIDLKANSRYFEDKGWVENLESDRG
jgi:hypothetical protein